VEQLELEVWIGYDCEFLHHTSMKREMISICVEQQSCKLIGCRTKDKLLGQRNIDIGTDAIDALR